MSDRERVVERLAEAGLDAPDRFVDVLDGEKKSVNHDDRYREPPSGNYGIYATARDRLVLLDVDDYDEIDDESGLSALAELPATLEQESPHGGTHRPYAVEVSDDGRLPSAVLEDEFGAKNPTPSWGEVRVANQYIVGAGSQLDGCDKDGCEACAGPDGGRYTLQADREVATIAPDTLVDVLQEDPELGEDEKQAPLDEQGEPGADSASRADVENILSYALEDSDDDRLRELWRGNHDGDRSKAEAALATKLGWWLGGNRTTAETKRLVSEVFEGRHLPDGWNRPKVEKWAQRDDDAYRQSVLKGVEIVDDPFSRPEEPAEAAADGAGVKAPEPEAASADREAVALEPGSVISKALSDPYGRLERTDDGGRPSVHDLRTAEAATYLWDVMEDPGPADVMAVSDGSFRAYEGGVWVREGDAGEQHLREAGERALRSKYSSNVLEQLKEETRVRNRYHVDELGIDEPWLVAGDEALNLETRETRPVEHDDLALRRIEAEYDPDAEPDLWLDFLSRVAASPETIKKVQEYFGYCLWIHGQPFGKGLFLIGDTDSGKGTALKTLEAILGRRENVANETLQDLIDTRWGRAQLHGRVVNVRNEVTPDGIKDGIETFKELLGGGDRVNAEFKGEQKFRFTVTQKLLFATNQFPTVENADDAFWNRCLFAKFPETIPEEEQEPEFHEQLLEERSGILNWMLDGLDRLFEQGGFTGERPIEEKKQIAEEAGSVLERFKQDALEITRDETDVVNAKDLYDLATAYADDVGMEGGLPPWQGGAFTNELKKWPGVRGGESRRVADGTDKTGAYFGVRVDEAVVDRLGVDVRTHDATPSGQQSL